jgi:perosamine synthetase
MEETAGGAGEHAGPQAHQELPLGGDRLAKELQFDMPYFQPPAGIPISLTDIAVSAIKSLTSSKDVNEFAATVCSLVNTRNSFLFSSGRAALAVILRAMMMVDGGEKNEVVIPAYTCYSVAAAVVRAGLKLRLCDVDSVTLDYNYESLSRIESNRVIAIVGCGLFGLTCDWHRISNWAAHYGAFTIDDAAQSFGIDVNGALSGTMGDAGFFSFGRGKNMTTYSGGMAITDREDLADCITNLQSELPGPRMIATMSTVVSTAAYSVFLRPSLYWIPESLPFLRLGETIYNPGFEIGHMGRFQAALGVRQVREIAAVNAHRASISSQLIKGFSENDKIQIPGLAETDIPYLRFPVLLASSTVRDRAIRRLRDAGICASGMYPGTIAGIPGIGEHLAGDDTGLPGADDVASRLITLPTHPYVKDRDVSKMIEAISGVVQDSPS